MKEVEVLKDLFPQYFEALELSKDLSKRLDKNLNKDDKEDQNKIKIANRMVNDMRIMTRWAETGVDPLGVYAANRIDSVAIDPYTLDSITTQANSMYLIDSLLEVDQEDDELYERKRMKMIKDIEDALTGITERERTAFVLSRAEMLTMTKIAEIMDLSHETVKTYVRRAEKKINENLNRGTQTKLELVV